MSVLFLQNHAKMQQFSRELIFEVRKAQRPAISSLFLDAFLFVLSFRGRNRLLGLCNYFVLCVCVLQTSPVSLFLSLFLAFDSVMCFIVYLSELQEVIFFVANPGIINRNQPLLLNLSLRMHT